MTALLLTTGGTAAQGTAKKAEGCLAPVTPSYEIDAASREAACLRELRAVASRNGDALTLRFHNGATETLRDRSCEQDDESKIAETETAQAKAGEDKKAEEDGGHCSKSFLVGYRRIARIFVILSYYYEGSDFALISARSGRKLGVKGVPHFSPDESMFIAIDNDHGYGGEHDLVLGTTVNDSLVVSWEHRREGNVKNWQVDKWIDKNRIAVRFESASEKCGGQDCTFLLERQGKRWVLRPTSPQ